MYRMTYMTLCSHIKCNYCDRGDIQFQMQLILIFNFTSRNPQWCSRVDSHLISNNDTLHYDLSASHSLFHIRTMIYSLFSIYANIHTPAIVGASTF